MFANAAFLEIAPCRPFGNAAQSQADRMYSHGRRARFGGSLQAEAVRCTVDISPPDIVKRRFVAGQGLAAEIIQTTSHEKIEHRFRAPVHLLIVCEQTAREDGETFVEGLPRSTLRNLARKLTFVPAGHHYHEWQQPRTSSNIIYFYFDPATLSTLPDPDVAEMPLMPRLFFEDRALWDSALKLKKLVERPVPEDRLYFDALGAVLAHELVRLNRGAPHKEPQIRGGLAVWQQRIATAYIEEHLAEQIPLSTLAQLTRLSPHYFCRAFKQSFGLPPHRYHGIRRVERAKALLARSPCSVTEIGLKLGFSETSSFSTAFRKATGLTPSAYHRSLG